MLNWFRKIDKKKLVLTVKIRQCRIYTSDAIKSFLIVAYSLFCDVLLQSMVANSIGFILSDGGGVYVRDTNVMVMC